MEETTSKRQKKDDPISEASAVEDFYREELMDVYRHPAHKGRIQDPTVEVFEKNPMCGDELTLQLDIQEGVIKNAKFHGSACVVSIVAAEFLTDKLIGLSVEMAANLSKEDLLKLVGLNLTTSRVKCATLVLTALKKALAEYENH